MPAPLKTFIIYARADEASKSQLLRHLRPLRTVSVWHDGNIQPGEAWDAAIKRELNASELILFLVSADSLNSDYIQSHELKTALERLQQGDVRLIPIVVAPCAWKFDPILSGLQALPLFRSEGVKPVRSWPDPDEAWASVVEHLGELVAEIYQQRLDAEKKVEQDRLDAIRRETEAEAAQKAAEQREQQRRREAEDRRRDREAFATSALVDAAKAAHRPRRGTGKYFSIRNLGIAASAVLAVVLGFGVRSWWMGNESRQAYPINRQQADSSTLARLGISQETPDSHPEQETSMPPAPPPKASFIEPDMVNIAAGSFQMGSANSYDDEKPIHTVRVPAFQLAKTEVTFEEYDLFCVAKGRKKPSDRGWGRGRRPVIYVSADDANAYCAWLSQVSGKTYRLPSEAEWEYAARGGNQGKGYIYAGSNKIGDVAWYSGNAGVKTHPVGEKQPNELGLYDMSGNVWEWCQDWYNSSYRRAPTDGSAWLEAHADLRVNRGGSWKEPSAEIHATSRLCWFPENRNNYLGFRLARSL